MVDEASVMMCHSGRHCKFKSMARWHNRPAGLESGPADSESSRRTGTVACRGSGTVKGVRLRVMVTGIITVTDGHCGHKSDGMLTVWLGPGPWLAAAAPCHAPTLV